jgi:hypothetical protein
MTKVLPCPGVLSTDSVPPCNSTSPCAIARAQSGADRTGTTDAVETLEDPLLVLHGDARSVIGDEDPHLAGIVLHPDANATSVTAILLRVGQQITQDSTEPIAVRVTNHRLGGLLHLQRRPRSAASGSIAWTARATTSRRSVGDRQSVTRPACSRAISSRSSISFISRSSARLRAVISRMISRRAATSRPVTRSRFASLASAS